MTGDPPAPASGVGAAPLALYIHWPFCVTKCPYCDFNSHVRASIDEEGWRDALLADLAHEAGATPGARLTSIFFGGGTPSLMAPETLAAVIEAALQHWPTAPDVEITLEANPSSVEAARFQGFRAAGVNRVSLGIQALDDRALRLLGRPHDLAQGLAALDLAQAIFPRVSFDLIHGRPGQSPAAWAEELSRALSFGTGHLSAYQLTIEPGTRFETLARKGLLDLPGEDEAAEMFELTADMCQAAGLPAYEISNHARPGEESRHNLAYWTYADHAGVGPGAHGRRCRRATFRARRPEDWARQAREKGHGIVEEWAVLPEVAAREALIMGLRLTAGIDPRWFHARTGIALHAAIDTAARERLEGLGLVAPGEQLSLTRAGRGLLDAILAELALPLEPVAGNAT